MDTLLMKTLRVRTLNENLKKTQTEVILVSFIIRLIIHIIINLITGFEPKRIEEARVSERSSDRKESREERRRNKKSRWEPDTDKVVIPGMPTILPSNMSLDQERIYLREY